MVGKAEAKGVARAQQALRGVGQGPYGEAVPAGYKRTEVGVVPVEWEVVTIGSVSSWIGGGTPAKSTPEFWGGSIAWISPKDFVGNELHQAEDYITQIGVDNSSTTIIPEGGIVFVARSGVLRHTFPIAIVRGQMMAINQDLKARIADSDLLINEYLLYYTKSKQHDILRAAVKAGTTVESVDLSSFRKFPIPLPPLPEQRAIAGALGEADALLAALDGLIAKKAAVKQATLEELLSGRRRLGGDNPGARQILKMGELGQTYGGLTGKTKSDFGTGNKRYVTFMNVIYNTVVDSNLLERVYVTDKEKQNEVRKGDLLFNTSSETPGEVGTCAYVGTDLEGVYLNSFCFGFKLSGADVDGLYLAYLVNSPIGREKFAEQAQGATRYNLSKYNFKSIEFGFPSIKEQRPIATLLTTLDDELTALRARRKKLAAVKAGMMEQLLTGAVRLV